MKPCPLFSVLGLLALNFLQPACARETWEERSAERFKSLTDDHRRQISSAQPDQASVQPAKARKVLVFYRCEGFIHTSIPWGNFALQEMARKTGAFSVDLADQYAVFNPENLRQYDAILFNSSSRLNFPEASQGEAILDFIKSGKGIVGIHAATDSFYEWDAGAAMMGGQFCGHPWTSGGTWAFKLDDPGHRLNQVFHGRGFWHQDEIYQYDPANYQGEEDLRILISLDMSKEVVSERVSDPKYAKVNAKFKPGPREVPVSWVRSFGQGRLFSTNLGHNESTYTKPVVMRHLLDGIQYALGDLKADDTPTAKIGTVEPALAPEL